MRKIFITAACCLTAFANPAIAQLYGKGTPAEPGSTPFASVSQDHVRPYIFSRELRSGSGVDWRIPIRR
jgi:hypothetical protein